MSQTSRTVEQIVNGREVSDGAGVRLLRVLNQPQQRRLDPFLMLDEFRSDNPDDYIAGFPSHPHRGFETVTYMLDGRMRHRDNAGNEGLLGPGGVQWMTAGRGIVHSEIPEQQDGLMHGFQLWINLPAKNKMAEPGYRDIQADAIPQWRDEAGNAFKLLAGRLGERRGPVERPDTEPLYLDIALAPGASLWLPLPAGHHAFAYPYQGGLSLAGTPIKARQMAILDNRGDGALLENGGEESRLLLLAAKPLNEPIAQWGPFVMNSREEIETAIADYSEGRF
ncbi:Redox-sensitive bicupin YhaK, pirin superfamily [Chromobacterium violaceum]|uniref:pirin family protein n=1 Tax=Chromobacterium violaceum TaxID=536 RepID=UPI0005BC9D1D|nr:pirin family protein [Chromobacterium violaceum]KJH67156.1 pirin [Chromobacterium violaceum]KMN51033.1 pirin [Chromobacterium violaceum]KMN86312.1 pirin [Chromobacterium violaceum]KMN89876.1 pirin [Chromobacterium violaceum]KMO05021.1 pirin [Chromobacterium violaceum]